jgi:hypothetical protein
MSHPSIAQDQALAAFAWLRGLLDDERVARARALRQEFLTKGERLPLAKVLERGGFIEATRLTGLLQELEVGAFQCSGCGTEWSWNRLAGLTQLRCTQCRKTIVRKGEAERTSRDSAGAVPVGAWRLQKSVDQLETIGPYKILDELGRGSMGVVYLAHREGHEDAIALKVLSMEGQDAQSVSRFEREIKVASRLRHPGIIAVLDAGNAGGLRYFAMEFCRGETLREVLRRGPLPPGDAARMLREIADSVAFAHRQDVIHRDLKPDNVIIDEATGLPRLTDFGVARDLTARSLTGSGDLLGTPSYMAPEQILGLKEIDKRTDVYSIGVMLYECLAGVKPFVGTSAIELTQKVLEEEAPPIAPALGVPARLEAIARKAMSREREGRHATVEELRDELDAFLTSEKTAPPQESAPARASRERGLLLTGVAIGAPIALAAFLLAEVVRLRGEVERLGKDVEQARTAPVAPAGDPVVRELRRVEALARERRPDALGAWQALHGKARGDPLVELAYARFLAHRRRFAEAETVARALTARALEPDAALEARSLLAFALLGIPNKVDWSREVLDALARDDARGPHGLLARARLALLNGNAEEAETAAEESLAAGELAGAHVFLARLATRGYDPLHAMGRYMAEIRSPPEKERVTRLAASALRHADRAVELAPDDASAYAARSLVKSHLAIFRGYAHRVVPGPFDPTVDGCLRDATIAIELAEPDPETAILVIKARQVYYDSRNEDPAPTLDRVLASHPDDVEALVLRAFQADREQGPAGPFLRRALAADPRGTWALMRHVVLVDEGGRHPLVRAEWGALRRERLSTWAALALDRRAARVAGAAGAARAKLRAGLELAQSGARLVTARVPYDEAIALAPRDPVCQVELARLLLGRGRPQEALAALDAAASFGALPADTAALRGEALLRGGRAAEASRVFRDLAGRATGAAKLVAEANVPRASGDAPGARDRASQAVLRAPTDPDAHRALALALLEGDPSEPDAALAEAETVVDLEGQEDAEMMFSGSVLVPVLTATETPAVLVPGAAADLEKFLAAQWPRMDALARSGRWHERVARALAKAPEASGLGALGKRELGLAAEAGGDR